MKKHSLAIVSLLVLVGLIVTACAQPTPEVVEVTRVVTETEEVEVTKEVVTEVEVTKEVEKIVEVEKELEPVEIVLWTKEGEADGGLQFVQSLADAYTAEHPNVTFEVTNKDVETLREDFLLPDWPAPCPTCSGP